MKGVGSIGFEHEVTVLKGRREEASELLPRVHPVISLLKRWLMGTHQGSVSHKHLDYHLDEFTFRFNRHSSMNRGKLFYRLVQQAVAIDQIRSPIYRQGVSDLLDDEHDWARKRSLDGRHAIF